MNFDKTIVIITNTQLKILTLISNSKLRSVTAGEDVKRMLRYIY